MSGVGSFYDRWTDLFLRGSGPILQAGILPTGDPPREEPEMSVLALAERAGVTDGARILDAGCGVGGPATVIASRYPNASVDGVTISREQVHIARQRIADQGLESRVRVHLADYQHLPFADETFDFVLFLESTGYASDLDALCSEAFRVLEPGGQVYVKDVFCSSRPLDADEGSALEAFDRLWGCVRTKTVPEVLTALRGAGFAVDAHGELRPVGTSRLLGTMFRLNAEQGLLPSDLGAAFHQVGLNAPITFAEVKAVRPSDPE